MQNVEKVLADLLRKVLSLADNAPIDAVTRKACAEWDSLRHVKLMIELQNKLGVRFSAAEMVKLDSYASILVALKQKQK